MDILETLKEAVGCHYISDLREDPYRAKAIALLRTMGRDQCSDEERNRVLVYLNRNG